MNTKFILLFLGLFMFFSCDQNTIFEENVSVPDGVWNENNVVKFTFQVQETKIPYNIYLNVRNTELYPFKNLWLFVNTHAPDGKLQRDTFNCSLADDKGKWLGDGSGDIWDNQMLYKKSIGFNQKGTYTVEIQHGMRTNDGNLPFVMEIGLRLEKAKP